MAAEHLTRRTVLKFAGLISLAAHGWRWPAGQAEADSRQGYGTDPDLLARPLTWSLTLSARELAMLEALCEIVLPAESPHPSAAALGTHQFLNEWLNAPYPRMQADRELILNGLALLDTATHKAHGGPFTEANALQQAGMFDRACASESSVGFCRRLIELVCAGYYTTREGHASIGYAGNVALERFPGPPPQIVAHLQRALGELLSASQHVDSAAIDGAALALSADIQ